jgi:hypothetical protein
MPPVLYLWFANQRKMRIYSTAHTSYLSSPEYDLNKRDCIGSDVVLLF